MDHRFTKVYGAPMNPNNSRRAKLANQHETLLKKVEKVSFPKFEDSTAINLSLLRYSIFTTQNLERGHFDVTFTFGEKNLYAHSFVLWSSSEVFETMLFGGWKTTDPIPIKTSSYEDFKEFITFLYLGQCDINMENVMAIVDLAESYHVQLLKDKCDQVLTDIQPTPENVFKLCANLKIYSLQNALDNLFEFIAVNAERYLKNKSFLEADKSVVLDIVKMDRLVIKEEELFNAIYKWAEHQYHKQGEESPLWIKQYLSDILPHIRFPVMSIEFLHSYVGWNLEFTDPNGNKGKAFMMTVLSRGKNNLLIKYIVFFSIVTDKKQFGHANGHRSYQDIYEDINDYFNVNSKECYWSFAIKQLKLNNDIFDLDTCKIYVVRNYNGVIGLKDFSTTASNDMIDFVDSSYHNPNTWRKGRSSCCATKQ